MLPAVLFAVLLAQLAWSVYLDDMPEYRVQSVVLPCPIWCSCVEDWYADCSGLGLRRAPRGFTRAPTNIILAGNNFTHLRKADFIGYELVNNLVLHSCNIETIEKDFLDHFPYLTRLDLKKNKIRVLPRLASNNTMLEELVLRENLLTDIDIEVFNNSPNLTTLDLAVNQLQSLPKDIFARTPELTTLDLSRNRIQSLSEDIFAKTPQLTTLNLYSNYLQSLSKDIFARTPQLTFLELSTNRIQSLSKDIFAGNPQLTDYYLGNNLWICDCRLRAANAIFRGASDRAECYSPSSLSEIPVAQVNDRRASCDRAKSTKVSNGVRLYCDQHVGHKVVWTKDNSELDFNDDDVTVIDQYNVLVKNYEVASRIRCTCNTIPSIKNKRNVKAHFGKAPYFTFKSLTTSAREGEALELSCEASGDPSPIITWSFGDNEIAPSGKYQIIKGGRKMKIYPFLESDVGSYKCKATNVHGTIENAAKISLVSSEPPFIFDAPVSTTMDIGQQVVLRCKARGVPIPQLSWYFEGTRIPRRNTRYTISEDNIELTIEKLTRHDSGVYTCNAINSVGSATASATLSVSATITDKVDSLLNETTIEQIAAQARENVDRALSSTKESRKMKDPEDLRNLFKFAATLKKVDLGKAREIYEESIRLVQQHINTGLQFDAGNIAPNVSYEAVLPVSYVQTLMEKSGCQTGQFVESCDDICFFSKYRSYDGQCNNFEHPMWGVSEMAFVRLLPPRYENGFNTPVGWEKDKLYNGFKVPNARKVSRILVGTDDITPHTHLTAMTMQWGQFIDHDMTLTAPALTRHSYREGAFCNRTCENADPCFNIQLEADDPKLKTGVVQKYPCMEFERNGAACGSGETSPIFQRVTYRDQLNVLTSYLDGSAIYGNSEEQSLELRDLYSDHGLLRFDIVSEAQKPYLPFEKDSDMDCRRNYSQENPIRCFLAGDFRANEQLGLMSMHTIFLREHNRIASKLLDLNTNWDGETIFQETRKILGSVMQHITYTHWLPKILGKTTFNEFIGPYKGYNPEVNPTVANEFATAALRFAHQLINPHLFRFDKDFKPIKEGHIPLHKAFFAPERLLSEGGVDPLLRGLFAAPIKTPMPSQLLNKELTEKLFNRYHEVALDLAALNIQRGRDHGLPAWTEYRRYCNLSVPKTWDDMIPIVKNDTVRMKLKELYGVPENIDLWVGGVTEKRTPDALMGPTLACIIADQFRRLRDGDRFWYENEGVFTTLQLQQIKKASLAKIVCTNGDDIPKIQRDIFQYHGNTTSFFEECNMLPEINLNMWASCCEGTCMSATVNAAGRTATAAEAASDEPQKRKRRSHLTHKPHLRKHCEDEGILRKHKDRWAHSDDKCVECTCRDGEVWCKTRSNCRG